MEDKKNNSISYPILIDSLLENKISNRTFVFLLYFLNWKENFQLAENLFAWGKNMEAITEEQYNSLFEDMRLRKNKRGSVEKDRESQKREEIENELKAAYDNQDLQIHIGKNLLLDGGFFDNDSLQENWIFLDMSDKAPFSKGSFFGDMDNNSIRIMGFYEQKVPKKPAPRGGFQYRNNIPLKNKLYLFQFYYRTSSKTEKPSVILTKQWRLEPTEGKWKEVIIILNNKNTRSPKVKPMIRMRSLGSVWFDNLYFSEIELNGFSDEKDKLYIK